MSSQETRPTQPALLQRLAQDHYLNQEGLMVFTEGFHLRRGSCCGSGCRHCPFLPMGFKGAKRICPQLLDMI